jgi:hypothetical protein
MAQRRPAGLGQGDAASLKHIGGHFESLTIVTNEHVTARGVDPQGTPANHSHHSRHLPDVAKPAGNGSEWIIVNREPTVAEKSSSGHNIHHSGQITSPNTDSQLGRTPIPYWHSETAKGGPWNGLGQVLKKSTTATEVCQTRKGSKTSSMETRKDSTTQASFGDRNGYT